MLTTILIILLVLWLISAMPGPFNSGIGTGPNGAIFIVLIVILIFSLTGHINI